MENHPHEKSNWIQELSNQSWNLELVVSGAAIFSTSFLPELTDSAIASYYQNYQISSDLYSQVLPTLAYSFGKASAYLLISSFIVHFIFRAFWIALVGLRAAFPQGINFDNLPNTTKEMAEMYKEKFDSLDGFIVRLDKLCSQIFSIAFVLVLFSIMMALLYILGFVATIGFKTYLPSLYEITKPVFLGLLGVLWLFSMLIMAAGYTEKYREHPIIRKLYKATVEKSTFLYMGMYKPIQYINFTFGSNMPHKKYFKSVMVIGFIFFTLSIGIYTTKLFEHAGISMMESRNFFSSGSPEYQINSSFYDNQRAENDEMPEASIQSDVIQEPFLKLFINYSKVLDEDLSKICKEPVLADSLKNSQKRPIKDKARLECLGEYFQISLNDSTMNSNEFFFEKTDRAKGIKIYLNTEKCKIGRNTLYIKTLEIDSLPKKVWGDYVAIPFWYFDKK
ncbi:hypothetical protein EGI22_18870 [Lacihabitans sp. LS3-19]|uniref:hypothetical protein n=1 Tax=Lacihabitans sp. LS3-19 TaxID=2487335 RepID=UPI0020CF28B6|nr:hypothetical protein [Lacihabitans sp. LS3-19]MCP9769972.1 hypothetical protein [Lacihabitans sp. LS3-19]